jgi:predicted ATPase/DNA-binding winged helix-turn-helix (wHTH) protein
MDEESFTFGTFRLVAAQRMLLENGQPLHLGSRALDILITLVESAGETIPKNQLIARAWPEVVVDERALRVHVAALRKALGDGHAGTRYIANVLGRGYRFVAPVALERRQLANSKPTDVTSGGNLPTPLTRILGRDEAVADIVTRLNEGRFLTIVGPGGIGKTKVALAVAESMRSAHTDGTWFVELGALTDPKLVPSVLSAAFGICPSFVDRVSTWLRGKSTLVVLDSCDRVVAAAAQVAEELLRASPHICVLATSREPLRAEGEWLHRLPPLEVPPASANLTIGDALNYSAVRLFNDRASAIVDEFRLGTADLPAVIEICRRLDGVPLEIELAAAQVGVIGVRGLAARLDDRLALLTEGRRTALPRHRTLRAAVDWSYDLLPEMERIILKRLSVFVGDFTLEAAAAVAADDRLKIKDVWAGFRNLAMKSLIVADTHGDPTFYRLLDTTRLYALEKLTESGELELVSRRHSEFCRVPEMTSCCGGRRLGE